MTTATYRASAYMAAAGEMGVRVTVGTDRPDLLAELNPGGSITLDYNEPEAGAALISSFAKEFPVDAIAPVDDDTLILGAMAAEALGLPYHPVEAARTTRSKYELRKVLSEEGLPSPSFRLVSAQEEPEEIAASIAYPCVLKPTFLAASQGVIRANDETEFTEAYRRVGAILDDPESIARGGAEARMILVEDYLEGVEVAVEGLVVRGEAHILAIFDKPDPLEGPFFEETIYVTPSRLSEETQASIREETKRAARAIRLREGPLHAELRINDAGEIRVIDVAEPRHRREMLGRARVRGRRLARTPHPLPGSRRCAFLDGARENRFRRHDDPHTRRRGAEGSRGQGRSPGRARCRGGRHIHPHRRARRAAARGRQIPGLHLRQGGAAGRGGGRPARRARETALRYRGISPRKKARPKGRPFILST